MQPGCFGRGAGSGGELARFQTFAVYFAGDTTGEGVEEDHFVRGALGTKTFANEFTECLGGALGRWSGDDKRHQAPVACRHAAGNDAGLQDRGVLNQG